MSSKSSFRYEIGGNLIAAENPFADASHSEDLVTTLPRLGFHHIETLGNEDGIYMAIYSNRDGRWFLIAGDGLSCCVVAVTGWPAFMDALTRYAPIYSRSVV